MKINSLETLKIVLPSFHVDTKGCVVFNIKGYKVLVYERWDGICFCGNCLVGDHKTLALKNFYYVLDKKSQLTLFSGQKLPALEDYLKEIGVAIEN